MNAVEGFFSRLSRQKPGHAIVNSLDECTAAATVWGLVSAGHSSMADGHRGSGQGWAFDSPSDRKSATMTTKDMMTLQALLEKGSDADLPDEMIGFTAECLMALEVEGLAGAAHGERSPERLTHRNGCRDRLWETRAGTVELKIPKRRKGSDLPAFLEPRRMAQKALTAACIKGVSTRKVDDLVQAMGMSGLSRSQVSRLCGEIDGKIRDFPDRPLEGDGPSLWLDATWVTMREARRVVSVAVAVNDQGRREVLGMAVGASQAETFWTSFLRSLARRGLRGVCTFAQEDADSASAQWRQVADQPRPKAPKPATLMDEAEHDVLVSMTFPAAHRPRRHSTNPLERLHGEVKQRTNTVGIFPDEDAITRLIGAILLERNDEWAVHRAGYMTLEPIAPVSNNATVRLPAGYRDGRQAPAPRLGTRSSNTTSPRLLLALMMRSNKGLSAFECRNRASPLAVRALCPARDLARIESAFRPDPRDNA